MKRPLKQLKRPLKQLILTVCTWLLLVNVHFAAADTASDTEKLLNWAENTYPQALKDTVTSQQVPYCFATDAAGDQSIAFLIMDR